MSKTDVYELPIPNDDEEAEERGFEAILAIRSALIALDGIISDLANALSGKAASNATWSISSIEGLASALSDKMSADAEFSLSDLSDTEGVDDGATGYVLARLSSGKWAPISPQSAIGAHAHLISDIQDLGDALAGKFDKAGGTITGAVSMSGQKLTDVDLSETGAVIPDQDADLGEAGFSLTSKNLGNLAGTITLTPEGGNIQHGSNNGATTIAAPTADGVYNIILQITNASGAGAITLSGFTKSDGDTFTTTNGHKFLVLITKTNDCKLAIVRALQ